MDKVTRATWDDLHSSDREKRYHAFLKLLKLTDKRVTWAYEVWDDLLGWMREGDNHERAIAAQVLANLAKSDPKKRILKDFRVLLQGTRDERFVTARHTLQSIWKVGTVGKQHQELVVKGLTTRYRECIAEKNCTLIRFDIIQDFRQLYEVTRDEKLRQRALRLIETEADPKYRKKYASAWREK